MAKWTLRDIPQTNDLLGLMEINTLFQDAFAGMKVTLKTQHYTAFCFVSEAIKDGEVCMKDVEDFMSSKQVNTHRALHALKEAGLLSIDVFEKDIRQRSISITPKGAEIIRKIGDIFSSGHSATRTSIRRKIKEITAKAAHYRKLSEGCQTREMSDRRREISQILKGREGGGLVEVGSGYIKTSRGIVSLSVLLKRSDAYNVDELKYYLRNASHDEYETLMTPNPRTTVEREMREVLEALENMKEKS